MQKKNRRFSVVFLTVLLLVAFSITDAKGLQEPDVIVVHRTPTHNTFFPSVAKLDTNEVVCVFYDSPTHVSPIGRISLVRSSDQGLTWSDPMVIIDTELDDRDPHIVQLNDGRLFLSWFGTDHSTGRHTVYVADSTDYGFSWSAPRPVTQFSCATSEKVLELPDGRLLLPVYDSGRSLLTESTDGGKTWRVVAPIAYPSGTYANVQFNETALAYLGEEHIVAVMRTGGADGYSYIAHSYNLGRNWESPIKMSIKAHAPDMLVLEEGVFLTYGSVAYTGRWVAGLLGKPTENFAGAKEKIIYIGRIIGTWDMSYPAAVLLDEETLLVVFYDAVAGYIGGKFIKIGDLV